MSFFALFFSEHQTSHTHTHPPSKQIRNNLFEFSNHRLHLKKRMCWISLPFHCTVFFFFFWFFRSSHTDTLKFDTYVHIDWLLSQQNFIEEKNYEWNLKLDKIKGKMEIGFLWFKFKAKGITIPNNIEQKKKKKDSKLEKWKIKI